jgi:hypothetical protein
MKENKIPTAEEFLKNQFKKGNSIETYDLMIEFAKLHVEAALEAKDNCLDKYGMAEEGYENAYPLENIK